MNFDVESLYTAARRHLAHGRTQEAGRLVNEILERDFLHAGAWELLYDMFGRGEDFNRFQLDFTARWYPARLDLVRAFQRGVQRAPGVPPLPPETPARPHRPAAPKPSPKKRGSFLVTVLGLLTVVSVLAACLVGIGLAAKKAGVPLPVPGRTQTPESPPVAQEPVDIASLLAPVDGALVSRQQTALDNLNAASLVPPTIRVRDGAVRFATMQLPVSGQTNPADRAQYFLREYQDLFQLLIDFDQLGVTGVQVEDDRSTHVWLSQTAGDVPVYGSRIGVHFNPQGEVVLVNGGYLADAVDIPRPARRGINAADAGDMVLETMGWPEGFRTLSGELTIFAPSIFGGPDEPHWAWLLHLGDESGTVLLDALVDVYTADLLAIVPRYEAAFDLEIWDMKGQSCRRQGDAVIVADETGVYPGSPIGTAELYQWSQEIYDFWQGAFGRDSWDGAGGRIKILTQSSTGFGPWGDCADAGAFAFFGVEQGFVANAILMCPYSEVYRKCILAHEFTHGVTAAEIGLVSTEESGALNEAFSDIFAELLEAYDPATKSFGRADWNYDMGSLGNRNLKDPAHSVPLQITHVDEMKDYDWKLCNWWLIGDDCKYIFSSIPGHVAYLLAEGGETHGVRVEAIGYDKTAQLYYQTMAGGFAAPNITFEGARDLMLFRCTQLTPQLFDANDCYQVMNAWASVGVGDAAPSLPPIPIPTLAPEPTPTAVPPTPPLPGATPPVPGKGHIQVLGSNGVDPVGILSMDPESGEITYTDVPALRDALWNRGMDILPPASFAWVVGVSPWSPDGARILLRPNNGPGLYVMNVNGSDLIQLATMYVEMGVWSPDGTRIAYIGWDETIKESRLYIQAADGSEAGNPAPIGSEWGDSEIYALGWSPDGTKIIVVVEIKKMGKIAFYVVNVNTLQVIQIMSGLVGVPTWSPDSSRIAFCGVNMAYESGIHIINADGSDHFLINDFGCWPFWSPVRDQIIFLGSRNLTTKDAWFRHQELGVFVMQADGSEMQQIAKVWMVPDDLKMVYDIAIPFWSPDGTKFVFADYDEGYHEAYRFRIFDVNDPMSSQVRILECPAGCLYPIWVP